MMTRSNLRWWIAPGLMLGAFVILFWQVSSHGLVTRIDVHVRDAIQDAATSSGWHWLAPIGRVCADLGDQAPALLTLVVATALTVCRCRSWRPSLVAGGAALVLVTVIPLKIWVARPGPGQVVLGNANLGFFPSGHTADAMCCYTTAAFLLGRLAWPRSDVRRVLGAVAGVLVCLTIFGLLWSNYHWLSDIIGSLCWCGAWLLVLRRYSLRHIGFLQRRDAGSPQRST